MVKARLLLLTCLCAVALSHGAAAQGTKPDSSGWQPIFDGKTLTNWTPSKFTGAGEVKVDNGQIVIEAGRSLSGITWAGPDLPTTNYEISLQAMRVEGRDFFAGVTFPVGDSSCSLILGGWGGTVIGLSSVNSEDASQNSTSQSMDFDLGRWYNVRIKVTAEKIEVWLDDRQIISQDLKGNRITIRMEMEPSLPLGIATWKTKAALRDIRLHRL
jgi:hypothetical protein